MARRRGGDSDAYTFDLEPEGPEADDPAGGGTGAPANDSADGPAGDPAATGRSGRPWRSSRRVRARGSTRVVAARGGQSSTLLIDLDPDPDLDADAEPPFDDGPDGAGGDGPRDGGLRVAARRVHDVLRGRRLVAVVVVAALALTALVVDTVGDRGRLEALRAAPGGVLDLVDQPRELWRVGAEGDLPGGLAGVLDGVVAVQHRDRLLGIDPADGERRWSARLPDAASGCGPGMDLWSRSFQMASADQIVCVSATGGSGGDADPDVEADTRERSTVTVVDADGTVLASRTVMASHTMLFPGPDGGLVVVRWVGEARTDEPGRDGAERGLERLSVEELMAGDGGPVIEDGYDLQVRLEDAATGEERWSRTVPFDGTVDPSLCVRWSDDGAVSGVELRGGVQTLVRQDLLWVAGCGIDAWLTGDGDRLDRTDDPTTFEGFAVWPLGSGGFVAQEEADPAAAGQDGREPVARLLGPDGERRHALDGSYLVPMSGDGGGQDVQLLRRDDAVVAVDADGEDLWSRDLEAAAFAARTSQVAVVVDEDRAVHGLDLATGEELWSREDLLDGIETAYSRGFSPEVVDAAFTDGRAAVLVVAGGPQADQVHWLAVDVTTGEDLWTERTDGQEWGVHLAVDGHLLRWTPTEIVGLG
ncbi:outer membrane protein assembly factor BamB family protein [Isoptericola cucumis]|uniref:Pyrrolo-quinoline quinone repeat domain-containing protein n=1 Tax=Isoptericola cucumis TaxID=1776856 RepID=A0ABQ2BC73_9MICO|nr:PQQ-binding-like beta-propeller repeat protein [Isoptericola cucumis]GGI10961.1 hypothetical protein GCM10007368_33830 [Isoptericola cucumis]